METNYLYIKNNPDTTQLLIELKQKVWRGLMLIKGSWMCQIFILSKSLSDIYIDTS